MKTIEAFIKEIEGSAALQDELKAIQGRDALAAFLKKYDVSGTIEDFIKAIKAKSEAEGEISDDAAEAAAGGGHWQPITRSGSWSVWVDDDYRGGNPFEG